MVSNLCVDCILGDQFAPMLRECQLHQTDAAVIVTHNSTQLLIDSRDGITLPHGSHIKVMQFIST